MCFKLKLALGHLVPTKQRISLYQVSVLSITKTSRFLDSVHVIPPLEKKKNPNQIQECQVDAHVLVEIDVGENLFLNRKIIEKHLDSLK